MTRRTALIAAALGAATTAVARPALALPSSSTLSWSDKPALFFAPHQDDELLSMGSGIMEHVLAGRETWAAVVGRGDQTTVRTGTRAKDMPQVLGYTPTPEHMGAVRDREFRCTVQMLGARPYVPEWNLRQQERAFTVEGVYNLMAEVLQRFPGADVKTHSPYGSNPDHAACGLAAQRLYADGVIVHPPRYYVSPWDRGVIDLPELRHTVRELPYGIQQFYRRTNLPREEWGVGYRSVPRYFRDHAKNRTSWWHA